MQSICRGSEGFFFNAVFLGLMAAISFSFIVCLLELQVVKP